MSWWRFGFLFAVPLRAAGQTTSSSYVPNVNLEKVSDWLTMVLIGAGLRQASDLASAFTRPAGFVGPAFGESPVGPTIAGALMVHYVLVGFFQGFLLAYLWLPSAFRRIFPWQQPPNAAAETRPPPGATAPKARPCPIREPRRLL